MKLKFVEDATELSVRLVSPWMMSSQSADGRNCVRLARLNNGDVAVSHSRDPQWPALIFPRTEMIAFFAGVEGREFQTAVRRRDGW